MRYILIIICIVLADQGCKLAVLNHYGIGGTGELLHDFISISCIKNEGIAFGFFAGHTGILVCLTSLLVGGIIVYLLINKGSQKMCAALSFIAGGGVGNLIDRLRLGYVVDFIDFRFWLNTFNIADVFVVLGCILMVIFLIFPSNVRTKNKWKNR